ncbi:hypothetical protein EMIHUDRAFT_226409 [Emiliania huxleyi CCMP1516]|uniref:Apple domain-containing protein n=2 Tax=Emiliania huxleyi TaxID=2903 RepID=A0A0D3KKU6_EMIH1|nr:hypothetical protein EMIHUDRAFT_226409 [Emiliania huxleyi CCMP1516]EOD36381.1 hypothetical protein EMIHUDRAFT_226409 [Emiliania huxleyi CCMP1516]|eukprot:XP_005788810.1 hypothetical protein EMIHUDRAFT_226409 [Emiliania huxleyi CCMP1516]
MPCSFSAGGNVGLLALRRARWEEEYSLVATHLELDQPVGPSEAKRSIYHSVALDAADQLRHRAAWALSQVYVTSELMLDNRAMAQEMWLTYHDIFVRHAFGNLRDLLREVSYSPVMGEFLTLLGSRSLVFNKPDENFAREIMQLFTIGLYQLNPDGTAERSPRGALMSTYELPEIASFARAWTGFTRAEPRSNIESDQDGEPLNSVDPMRINATFRDELPKMDLHRGHIGDQLPLCIDLPPRSFLLRGARWRDAVQEYFSSSGEAGCRARCENEPRCRFYSFWKNNWCRLTETCDVMREADRPGFKINGSTSALGALLCGSKTSMGDCRFSSNVMLDADLPCSGRECAVDDVRYVNVESGRSAAIFEFVRPPCVSLTFYNDAKQVYLASAHVSPASATTVCADPATASAAVNCCDGETSTEQCEYLAEMVPFATAVKRCADYSLGGLCSVGGPPLPHEPPAARRSIVHGRALAYDQCDSTHWHSWTAASCTVQVQVRQDGEVNIVHVESGSPFKRLDSAHTFRVRWDGSSSTLPFPTTSVGCGKGCMVHGTTCLCETRVMQERVFAALAEVHSAAQVEQLLSIGRTQLTHQTDGKGVE